ncbi:unnamed protein product, partial [Polarella glacialis]
GRVRGASGPRSPDSMEPRAVSPGPSFRAVTPRRPPSAAKPVSSKRTIIDHDQLLEKVRQLELAKQAEEKERKKSETQRKKDLANAKSQMTKEIRSASRHLRKSEMEASKLWRNLQVTAQKVDQAGAKRAQQVLQLEMDINKVQSKRSELQATWEEKLSEVGEAKNKLANAEMTARLVDLGVVLPSDTAALADISFGYREGEHGQLVPVQDQSLRDENTRLCQEVNELRARLDRLEPAK